jgi:hypothetical protein
MWPVLQRFWEIARGLVTAPQLVLACVFATLLHHKLRLISISNTKQSYCTIQIILLKILELSFNKKISY